MDKATLLAMARGFCEKPQCNEQVISSYDAAIAFLHLAHGNPRNEIFSVMFLDKQNALLEHKIMTQGTVDHVPVYVREVVRHALLIDASALILCHNHPSGRVHPSAADVAMTAELVNACGLFGVLIHDHYILGHGSDLSMRANGNM